MKDKMLNDCLATLPLVAYAVDLLVPGPEVPRLRLRRRRQVEKIVFDDALGSSSSSRVIRAFLLPLQIGQFSIVNTLSANTVCPGSSDPPEKYLLYLHQKMRVTPFICSYDNLG